MEINYYPVITERFFLHDVVFFLRLPGLFDELAPAYVHALTQPHHVSYYEQHEHYVNNLTMF